MVRFIVFCGVCSVFSAGAVCECDWAEDNACGDEDSSECWLHCCGKIPTRRPPKPKVYCDCSWTKDGLLCGPDDQSDCWPKCCGKVKRCSANGFQDDYGTANCLMNKSAITMYCMDKDDKNCGMRMSSKQGYGSGRYSADVRAAPGPGVCTTLYTYSFGRQNMQDKPWNEIDFEILGHHVNSNSTSIWTNYWWGLKKQDPKFILVPFDATQDFHNYVIDVDCTTIRWIVDGIAYRTVKITEFGDFQCTLDERQMQVYLALWGQTKSSGDWSEMAWLDNRADKEFPLTASFKNIVVPVGNKKDEDCKCKQEPERGSSEVEGGSLFSRMLDGMR